MPLYFFHLSFGDRTVPDDEGVELPNRSAAREEALAVVRDLSNPEVAGNPRRWASWFLQVADEGGEFLRMPIGHPALEVVTSDGQQPQAESSEMKPARPAGTVATRQGRRSAPLVQQMSAVRKQTEQLLQRNQQLRHELSVVCLASESIRVRASRLVSLARRAGSPTGDIEAYRIANKPTRHTPHLVVLQQAHPPYPASGCAAGRVIGCRSIDAAAVFLEPFLHAGSLTQRIDTLNAGRYR